MSLNKNKHQIVYFLFILYKDINFLENIEKGKILKKVHFILRRIDGFSEILRNIDGFSEILTCCFMFFYWK